MFTRISEFKFEIVATFRVPTFAVVVRAFEADILPVTVKLVSVTTPKLAVEATFRVVEFINGIVRVSKLKIVLFVLDEKPDAIILVVTMEFAA